MLDGRLGGDAGRVGRSAHHGKGEDLAVFQRDEDLALVVDCRPGLDDGAGEVLETEVGAVVQVDGCEQGRLGAFEAGVASA